MDACLGGFAVGRMERWERGVRKERSDGVDFDVGHGVFASSIDEISCTKG